MGEEHMTLASLMAFVEGAAESDVDLRVERHLWRCGRCSALADGYARFAVDADPAEEAPELEAASARLAARLRPLLAPPDSAPAVGLVDLLRHAFGLGEMLDPRVQRLWELATGRPGLRLSAAGIGGGRPVALAASPTAEAEILLEHVRSIGPGSEPEPVRASLADAPRWPAPVLDLLLELDLRYRGWNAAVGYVLEAPESEAAPAALLLYEGKVDAEGLIHVDRPWEGPLPERFEASRLRVVLVPAD